MMLFNPLSVPIKRSIEIPVYYTGRQKEISIREKEGPARTSPVKRDHTITLEVNLPAKGYSWWIFE